jgi:His/Glu/Gln/Arg/opine family amino acid ABC transporter permease subunit
MLDHFLSYFFQLSNGLVITLLLMFFALILGGFLAWLLTFCLISKNSYLKMPASAFVFFIRGTPLLVQFFLIYFGLSQFDWLRDSPLWFVLKQPFFCAVIALALNNSAYTAVLFKGAVDSVPPGEVLACEALGMSRIIMFRHIIFPRVMRIILPAYSNEVVIMLKSTSLASTITLLDLMGMTNQIISENYQALPFLCLAAAIYLVLNVIFMRIFHHIKQKANRYLHT